MALRQAVNARRPPCQPPIAPSPPVGLIKDVVEKYPEAIVVGSKVCLAFLGNLMHTPFKQQAVKGGDKVGGLVDTRGQGWNSCAGNAGAASKHGCSCPAAL